MPSIPQSAPTDSQHATTEVFASARNLPPDFQQAMDIAARESLQLSIAWMTNLEDNVFGPIDEVRYLALRLDGKPAAVLPTLLAGRKRGRHVASLSNYYTAIYQPWLASGLPAQMLGRLLTQLRELNPGLASLRLSPMDPASEAFATLERALTLSGFATYRYFCFGNWFLQAPKNWQEYLAGREGKQRSTIKRMTQRIASDAGHVEIMTRTEDLERGLMAYQHVYDRSWKVPEPSANFMPGLMRLCAQMGAMRLGIVWLKEQPIAAQFWIVSHGRAEIYKVAYDEAFKSHSPGTVLTAQLLKHVLEQDGVHEVDYLIGDDTYKKNWMSHRRERWGLMAYNRHSIWGLFGAMRESLGRKAKAVFITMRSGLTKLLPVRGTETPSK